MADWLPACRRPAPVWSCHLLGTRMACAWEVVWGPASWPAPWLPCWLAWFPASAGTRSSRCPLPHRNLTCQHPRVLASNLKLPCQQAESSSKGARAQADLRDTARLDRTRMQDRRPRQLAAVCKALCLYKAELPPSPMTVRVHACVRFCACHARAAALHSDAVHVAARSRARGSVSRSWCKEDARD